MEGSRSEIQWSSGSTDSNDFGFKPWEDATVSASLHLARDITALGEAELRRELTSRMQGSTVLHAVASGGFTISQDGDGTFSFIFDGRMIRRTSPAAAADLPPMPASAAAAAAADAAAVGGAGAASGPAAGPAALTPSMKVRRGPAWRYGDQDGGAGTLGTVLAVANCSADWVVVAWDAPAAGGAGAGAAAAASAAAAAPPRANVYRYRAGVPAEQDVIPAGAGAAHAAAAAGGAAAAGTVPAPVPAPPSLARSRSSGGTSWADAWNGADLPVGTRVVRGPDWRPAYGNQDGGPGRTGVVVRSVEGGWLRVKWDASGSQNAYRYSAVGAGPRDVIAAAAAGNAGGAAPAQAVQPAVPVRSGSGGSSLPGSVLSAVPESVSREGDVVYRWGPWNMCAGHGALSLWTHGAAPGTPGWVAVEMLMEREGLAATVRMARGAEPATALFASGMLSRQNFRWTPWQMPHAFASATAAVGGAGRAGAGAGGGDRSPPARMPILQVPTALLEGLLQRLCRGGVALGRAATAPVSDQGFLLRQCDAISLGFTASGALLSHLDGTPAEAAIAAAAGHGTGPVVLPAPPAGFSPVTSLLGGAEWHVPAPAPATAARLPLQASARVLPRGALPPRGAWLRWGPWTFARGGGAADGALVAWTHAHAPASSGAAPAAAFRAAEWIPRSVGWIRVAEGAASRVCFGGGDTESQSFNSPLPWIAPDAVARAAAVIHVRTADLANALTSLCDGATGLVSAGVTGFVIAQDQACRVACGADGSISVATSRNPADARLPAAPPAGFQDVPPGIPEADASASAAAAAAPPVPPVPVPAAFAPAPVAGLAPPVPPVPVPAPALVRPAVGGAGAAPVPALGAAGAPRRPQLYRLPSGTVEETGAVNCVICCEEISTQGLVFTSCSHMFCKACGESYIAGKLLGDSRRAEDHAFMARTLRPSQSVACPTCRTSCSLGNMLLVSAGLPLACMSDLLARIDKQRNSPLHHAASMRLHACYELLKTAGANDTAANRAGITPAALRAAGPG